MECQVSLFPSAWLLEVLSSPFLGSRQPNILTKRVRTSVVPCQGVSELGWALHLLTAPSDLEIRD